MTAADKIAEARALIGFANRMSYAALRVGLEGTAEWDQIAGAVDIYHVQDALSALADLADAQAQEIARLTDMAVKAATDALLEMDLRNVEVAEYIATRLRAALGSTP